MEITLLQVREKIFKNKENRSRIARTARIAYLLAHNASEIEIHKATIEHIDIVSDLVPFFAICGGMEDLVDLGITKNCYESLIKIAGIEYEDPLVAASTLCSRLSADSTKSNLAINILRRGKWKAWITGFSRFENIFEAKDSIQPFKLSQEGYNNTNPAELIFCDCLQFVMVARDIIDILKSSPEFYQNDTLAQEGYY